ncbi:MAG: TolC family protein [Phycisphaerales bacterium]|nr:TolC family protein [Phycisphaerales bacterium]
MAISLAGCVSPLDHDREQALRRGVLDTVRQEVADAELRPDPRTATRATEPLPVRQDFMPELEKMAGPASRDFASVNYGEDLMGGQARTVGVSLERAVHAAVQNNLELQFARLAPAISEADVVSAEAAFDWVFFNNFNWTDRDQESPTTSLGITNGRDQRQVVNNATGIRRPLESGSRFSVQQELIYTDFETRGLTYSPDPATQAALTLQFDQPLLRNFGSDVALAQVRLNRNAERDAVAKLRIQLIQKITQTETTYWELVRAQHDVVILSRLLERGIKTRDQLDVRLNSGLDVPPSQLADAVARVERRKIDVFKARDAVREASDKLKVLMNDPDLPVGTETLVTPLDQPVDEAMSYSLLDSLTTAVQRRPEIDQAVLSIDNTSIRQTVAANQRLPQLDLQVQTRFQGMASALGAVSDEFDGRFVDYVVGLAFEQPIGNRAAEATDVRRRLEREQAVISYRNTVQQIVRDVKSSLRTVLTNYQIIGTARSSRITAADSLRALEVENDLIRDRSSERLELEFNRQEALASAERSEIQAITDLNSSVAQLYASMGTSLERNSIKLAIPTAEQALAGRRSADWWESWGRRGEAPAPATTAPEAEPAPDAPPADLGGAGGPAGGQ